MKYFVQVEMSSELFQQFLQCCKIFFNTLLHFSKLEKQQWNLNKWDSYMSISEISMKILTDVAINATVNPTNTPMA